MTEIYNWNELSPDDQKYIMDYTSKNNLKIRDMVRNEFPGIYIGRDNSEVARGWLMVAGLDAVKKYIDEK